MPKYTIEIEGDGGEFIAGEVRKEFYDALKENGIAIKKYAEGGLNGKQLATIPEEIRPFYPGEWFEIRPYIAHATLAKADATISVRDHEKNETVYRSSDDEAGLSIGDWYGVEDKPQAFSIYDPGGEWAGKYVYTCQRHEDGLFFIADIELDEPFDKEKLLVIQINYNEQDYIAGLVYFPDGFDGEREIEIQGEFGDSEINGATHELMEL